jgi:hypothetical protein
MSSIRTVKAAEELKSVRMLRARACGILEESTQALKNILLAGCAGLSF